MNERAVRAASQRITREAHGLFVGADGEYRLVPVAAIVDLIRAVAAEPDAPASPWPDPDARPRY